MIEESCYFYQLNPKFNGLILRVSILQGLQGKHDKLFPLKQYE